MADHSQCCGYTVQVCAWWCQKDPPAPVASNPANDVRIELLEFSSHIRMNLRERQYNQTTMFRRDSDGRLEQFICKTAKDLAGYSAKELRSLGGLGAKSLQKIREQLAAHGFKLKGE